jgi:hypothetical protein
MQRVMVMTQDITISTVPRPSGEDVQPWVSGIFENVALLMLHMREKMLCGQRESVGEDEDRDIDVGFAAVT